MVDQNISGPGLFAVWIITASVVAGAVFGAVAPLVIVLSGLDGDHLSSIPGSIFVSLLLGVVGVIGGTVFGGALGVLLFLLYLPLRSIHKSNGAFRVPVCVVAAVVAGSLASLLVDGVFASSGGHYSHEWVVPVLEVLAFALGGSAELFATLHTSRTHQES